MPCIVCCQLHIQRCIGEDENEFAHEFDSDIPDDSDEITHTNMIELQNGLGQMRKRKRKTSNMVAQLQH